MIPIRRRSSDISLRWLERAQRARAELDACADDPENAPDGTPLRDRLSAKEKRAIVFRKRSAVWSDLKAVLSRWSYDKCWYTEARDVVSDYHVDHFRPKGRVTAHPDKPTNERDEGYWWLAFDWRNYRLAGAWSNSPHHVETENLTIGKWDYFPLLNERFKATSPADAYEREQALLLDPTDETDTRLLMFNESGAAVPAVPASSTASERVRIAIKILGLDSPRLKEERRRKWREVERVLEAIARIDELPDEERSPYWQDEQRDRLEELVRMTAPDTEFCATARACVRALAHHLSDLMAPLDGSVLAEPDRWKAGAVTAEAATEEDGDGVTGAAV